MARKDVTDREAIAAIAQAVIETGAISAPSQETLQGIVDQYTEPVKKEKGKEKEEAPKEGDNK